MRVFYDHQVTSLQDAGGVSRYYFDLVRGWKSVGGVDAEWMAGWNQAVLPINELGQSAKVLSYPTSLRPGYFRYALNEGLTGARAPGRGVFDVYHTTYQRVLPYVRRRAVVATHHDSTPDKYAELFPDADAIHARLKKVYARADRVICISEASRSDLLRYFDIAEEKTEVIHHGFTRLARLENGASAGLPERPYVLYVGSRAAYKNFPLVLKAMAAVKDKDLQLLVAGGGAWSAKEAAVLEKAGLQERVHLLPRLTDGVLAEAYRGARMFVYPSLYEGFGFPPLEAMDAGCPAIVSRTSSLPEVCGDAAFYFDPRVLEELVALMDRMSMDEQFRLEKRAAGFAQAGFYTWEKTAQQTLNAYRKALSAARG